MADTTVQREAAEWVRDNWLPGHYGQAFERRTVHLTCGGSHEFAAVSADSQILGTITTGRVVTTGAKSAAGKLNKVRADLYFALLAPASKRFIAATDAAMADNLIRERDEFQRIPADIDILKVELPWEIQEALAGAQAVAAEEVGG